MQNFCAKHRMYTKIFPWQKGDENLTSSSDFNNNRRLVYPNFRWTAWRSEGTWLEVSKVEKLGLRICFENRGEIPANVKFTVLSP